MSGNSIRFSNMKGGGTGGADAWRDAIGKSKPPERSSAFPNGRPRTSGTKIPKPDTIHKALVVCVKEYGAFVQVGDGTTYRDAFLHISMLGARDIERVEDVVKEGQHLWVKVAEINDAEGKYGVDIRYVSQKDGTDLDPYKAKSHILPQNFLEPANPAAFQGRTTQQQAPAVLPPRETQPSLTDSAAPDGKLKKTKKKKKKKDKDSSSDSSDSSVSSGGPAPTDEERQKMFEKLEKARRKNEKLMKKLKAKDKKKKLKKERKRALSSDDETRAPDEGQRRDDKKRRKDE